MLATDYKGFKIKKAKKIKNFGKLTKAFWTSVSNGLQRIQNKRDRNKEKILYTKNSRAIV